MLLCYDAPYLALLEEGGMSGKERGAYLAELGAGARARLAAWLRSVARPGVQYQPLVMPGDPRQHILDEAERRGADLIVVGSKRHTRIGGLLLGSVSERIARSAERDLLVVR